MQQMQQMPKQKIEMQPTTKQLRMTKSTVPKPKSKTNFITLYDYQHGIDNLPPEKIQQNMKEEWEFFKNGIYSIVEKQKQKQLKQLQKAKTI